MVKAIAFDAYGTLCYLSERTNPYEELLEVLDARTRASRRLCMTCSLDLTGLAGCLAPAKGIDRAALAAIERKMQAEVASVRLFPDTVETLRSVRASGLKVGVVSNLAPPYAVPLQSRLGDLVDYYAWSFEVGAVKPELAMFAALCRGLECPPAQVLMVGDSLTADIRGARQFGMPALHLRRDGRSSGSAPGITDLAELLARLDTGVLP